MNDFFGSKIILSFSWLVVLGFQHVEAQSLIFEYGKDLSVLGLSLLGLWYFKTQTDKHNAAVKESLQKKDQMYQEAMKSLLDVKNEQISMLREMLRNCNRVNDVR
jgi:hypothetical protein